MKSSSCFYFIRSYVYNNGLCFWFLYCSQLCDACIYLSLLYFSSTYRHPRETRFYSLGELSYQEELGTGLTEQILLARGLKTDRDQFTSRHLGEFKVQIGHNEQLVKDSEGLLVAYF
jgi:hypothetical protein